MDNLKPFNGIAKLKRFSAKLDNPTPEPIKVEVVEAPVEGPAYSIYKRSLPTRINKPVYFNLSQSEAYQLAMEFLKTKTDVINGDVEITYYDVVREDSPEQKNVLWNPRPCVVKEGSKPDVVQQKPKLPEDLPWAG